MTPTDQTIFGDGSDGTTPGNCMQAAVASILDMPLECVPHFLADRDHWRCLEDFLNPLGLWPLGATSEGWSCNHGGYYLACGPAARGFTHIVVYYGDKMVHDPHPSRAGLLTITDYVFFVALNPAKVAAL